jgi:hypothetical protein
MEKKEGEMEEEEEEEEAEEEEEKVSGEISDEKKLENYYFKHAKKGIVLTFKELRKFCSAKGLRIKKSSITSLRYKFKELAIFSRYRNRHHYMGSSIEKPGVIQIDLGYFRKDLKAFNRQVKYLLVGVDCLSEKLSCIPMTNKKQETWKRAIHLMQKNDYNFITTLISDRDSSIGGKAFQERLKEEEGINWIHLRTRSKAFRVERMLRFIKTRLSTALSLNEVGDLNYLQHLPGILSDYNSRFIKGTKIRRKDASKKNYMKILRQKLKMRDPESYFNTSVMSNFSPTMASKIFKYKKGDKVLLATYVDYSKKPLLGTFEKKSVTGSFGKRVYTVVRSLLKSNSNFFLSIVYQLSGLKGYFYETELAPALFSEAEEEEKEKEKEKEKEEEEKEEEGKRKEERPGGKEEEEEEEEETGEKKKKKKKKEQEEQEPQRKSLRIRRIPNRFKN